jgi:hypothetical protein
VPDPNYPMGLEIRKLEYRKIIEILGKGDFKQLMKIYIPRTVGVADKDKPYLDWMDPLIHDLLTARPMWQTVYKQPQTPGHILATTSRAFTLHRQTRKSVKRFYFLWSWSPWIE